MPQANLTEKFVAAATAPAGKDRELFWEPALPGFALMVTAAGARSFIVQYRTAEGASRRMKVNGGSLALAKREARAILGQVAKGVDPLAAKRKARDARADTLRRIVEDEYLPDPDVKRLRSVAGKRWAFGRYIFPTLGSRPIAEIKRSEIVRMLARVRQKSGPGAANDAFKVLSSFFTWYAPRSDDDFRSPIVRGIFRQAKGEGARTLADDEIRILWNVTGEGRNPYDHFVRLALLTATRRNEAAGITRAELSRDGTE